MIRSMYSGVAGMKVQQTRMDVIGNNISNVGTHGYKSGRATFRDVYYQTNMAATGPTGVIGGRNAMEVGVGTKMGSIDINHSQAVMTTTGYALDVAIAGEGYLQVQDRSGNIFYTKAGMLDIDAAGNLVDINGNYVLGVSGDPYNQGPDSKRIAIKLPNTPASSASTTELINKKNISIETTEKTDLANAVINFEATNNLPLNSRAVAKIESGSILIQVNQNEIFRAKDAWVDENGLTHAATTWLDEFQSVINDAIKEAGGDSTVGKLNINIDDPAVIGKATYKASDIMAFNYDYKVGGVGKINATTGEIEFKDGGEKLPGAWGLAGFEIKSTGSDFGKQFSESSVDSILNRKVADTTEMMMFQVDLNNDGAYKGINDGLAMIYKVTDTDGNIFYYGAVESREALQSEGSVKLKLLTSAEIEDINKKKDPADTNVLALPQIDVEPTEADSITLKFPKLSKMEATVTSSGVTNWNLYSTEISKSAETIAKAGMDTAQTNVDAMQTALAGVIPGFTGTAATVADAAAYLGTDITKANNAVNSAQLVLDNLLKANNNAANVTVALNGINSTLAPTLGALYTAAIAPAATPADQTALDNALNALPTADKAKAQALISANDKLLAAQADLTVAIGAIGAPANASTVITALNNLLNANNQLQTAQENYAQQSLILVASDESRALGFGSNKFALTGGTEGGPQDASDLTSISINDRGILSGIHATLGYLEFGRIDLATFKNPKGLTQVGNTYFAVSSNSGDPRIAMAGSSDTGAIASSTLETSNVDLSNEFSDMIVTQRGFQANSRIITVSDGMIEELVNLKRG